MSNDPKAPEAPETIGPTASGTPAKKKPFTLSEDDIRIDRRVANGSFGRVGTTGGGSGRVIDPSQRGPGAPSDPDA
jgi:hypothetical protein